MLSLFPDDEEWLPELLETSLVIGGAYASEEPSYYFEASLKAKFLAGEIVQEAAVAATVPAATFSPVRTAFASVVVLIAAAGMGGAIFGFVTAEDSVPGGWNYAFKLAGERLEYSLSRGDGRVDVQLNHAEARIYEIQQLSDDGNLTEGAIKSLTRELGNLLDLATHSDFDPVQTAKTNSIYESTVQLLEAAKATDQSLDAPVAEAITRAEQVFAAANSNVGAIPEPTETVEPDAADDGETAAEPDAAQ